MPDGSIVLMGGYGNGPTYLNDTWRSTDNGRTWTAAEREFRVVGTISNTAVSRCRTEASCSWAVMMGAATQNDVWRSTDYGVTWTQLTGCRVVAEILSHRRRDAGRQHRTHGRCGSDGTCA